MRVSGGLAFGDQPVLHGLRFTRREEAALRLRFSRVGFFFKFHEVAVSLPPEWVIRYFHFFSFFLSDLPALPSTDVQPRAILFRTSRHPLTVLSGNMQQRHRDPRRDSSPPPVTLNWRWLVTCAIAPST